ncbi:MAG: hypothetical protein ACI9DJ_002809 [Algoriphagus sp.]|jgi:hypothetical protein
MKKSILPLLLIILASTAFAQDNSGKISALISQTEAAMGGQESFDKVRNLSWDFFGARTLTWDKKKGNVRIDMNNENTVFLFNSNTKTGRALINGVECTDTDSLAAFMESAHSIWINDSYWLTMPFKLDDPGVTLKYLGEMEANEGQSCDVLELTFSKVGLTPNNKYNVYIAQETNFICQWDFFTNYSDEEPRFSTPWKNYIDYNGVFLSGDRGEKKLSNIQVFKKLHKTVYTSFDKPVFIN